MTYQDIPFPSTAPPSGPVSTATATSEDDDPREQLVRLIARRLALRFVLFARFETLGPDVR